MAGASSCTRTSVAPPSSHEPGTIHTKRFPAIAAAVAALPIQSAIIDGELTACDCRGVPDFRALHFRNVREDELCVWTFDIPRRPRSGNGSCG